MVTVVLPGALADQAGGQRRFEVDGPTVEAALLVLPVAELVLGADGELKPIVRVYLDGKDVRELDGAATPAPDGSEVRVVASAAGGS
jgi:molybdopterin converting factor small subunit